MVGEEFQGASGALDVKRQDVLSRRGLESGHGWHPADAGMGAVPVVVVLPPGQQGGAFAGVVVDEA